VQEYPPVIGDESIGGGFVGEVVHGDELFREVVDFHAHVFWACH